MRRGLSFVLFLFISVLTIAQETGSVRGFVYDTKSEEPIIFTNVLLKGTTIGAATDVNGYFMISKIPPGDYTLITTFIGYDTASVPVTVIVAEQVPAVEAVKSTDESQSSVAEVAAIAAASADAKSV